MQKRLEIRLQGHMGQNSIPSFPDVNACFNSQLAITWCTSLRYVGEGNLYRGNEIYVGAEEIISKVCMCVEFGAIVGN